MSKRKKEDLERLHKKIESDAFLKECLVRNPEFQGDFERVKELLDIPVDMGLDEFLLLPEKKLPETGEGMKVLGEFLNKLPSAVYDVDLLNGVRVIGPDEIFDGSVKTFYGGAGSLFLEIDLRKPKEHLLKVFSELITDYKIGLHPKRRHHEIDHKIALEVWDRHKRGESFGQIGRRLYPNLPYNTSRVRVRFIYEKIDKLIQDSYG